MPAPTLESETNPEGDGWSPDTGAEEADTATAMAFASVALSAVGFLTLLRLADRSRPRTPARALGLFLATSAESLSGTVLGLTAVARSREVGRPSRNMLVGAAGAVLGVVTTVLNVNWMRTRRRL